MNIITILVIVKTIMVKQYAAGIVGTKSVFVENTKKYWAMVQTTTTATKATRRSSKELSDTC